MSLVNLSGNVNKIDKDQLYEDLRKFLSPENSLKLPKNKTSSKLLTNMYTETEAFVIVKGFKKPLGPRLGWSIRKNTKIPKKELKKILEEMLYKGKLIKKGPFYLIFPYIPGGFEFYFTTNRDDPERMKKAAEAHDALFYEGYPLGLGKMDPTVYRVIPSIEPTKKTYEINKSMDVDHQILTYELMEHYLAEKDIFAVVPCSCRTAAALAGNPCKKTKENFCITAGALAKNSIESGVGREVSLEELIEVMKKAEKEGLVHQTFNVQEASLFICNCCSCCCGFLKSVKELNNYGAITKSNFEPRLNYDKCTLCEKCINICPMEAISLDNSLNEDERVNIDYDLCIGCGICASNCPQEAFYLVKVRDVVPVKNLKEYYKKLEILD
ncbi:MAG: 4Fe-4S dicluster domain-containing protein [Promethearchaeota archaeon]|nr:MAG: 4Fe-4S dicluster domain-containing protein [Candidatus Lokiarchaeota archaeon]